MSTPGMQPGGGGNPLDALNGLFGGHDRTIYPPAPAGYRYEDVSIPKAPPGYAVQTMRQIASGGTTPRQPRGAAQELRMLQNPGYKPRLSQTGSNPVQAMWDRVDAAKSGGAPSVSNALARSSLAPSIGLVNTVQKILDRVNAAQTGSAAVGSTPRQDAYPTQEALPGLSASVAPPSDATQSKLDAAVEPNAGPQLLELSKGLPGVGVGKHTGFDPRNIPGALQSLWERMNTPSGPAFDPHNVDLGEQRYDPLPGEEDK